MKTLIFVHGGMSFATREEYLDWLKKDYVNWIADEWKPSEKKWKPSIAERFVALGGRVFMPEMPCDLNAKYDEWLITFNGLLSTLETESEIIFIGHSLGGCFLLKYFSDCSVIAKNEAIQVSGNTEHGLLRTSQGQSLKIHQIHLLAACISEGDFTTPTNYEYLQKLGNRVHIWHAEDDTVVPFSTAQELSRNIPGAVTHFFSHEKGYGHFHGVERIPELEEAIFS